MSNSIVSVDHILNLTVKEMKDNNWRFGQALYNTTYIYYPEFCDARTGTEDDPFYSDDIFCFATQKWRCDLKYYIEHLLEKKEAELSASNDLDHPTK